MSSPQPANSRCERRIDLAISERFRKELSVEWLEKVAADALQSALPEGEPGQLSLMVTDEDALYLAVSATSQVQAPDLGLPYRFRPPD